jgi:hypothetical protein
LVVTFFVTVVADGVASGRRAARRTIGAAGTGKVVGTITGLALTLVAAIFERTEPEVESVNFLIEVLWRRVVGSRGDWRGRRVTSGFYRHGRKRGTFRVNCEAFELNSLLEGVVEVVGL